MNKVQTEHWISVSGSVSSPQNKQDQASVSLLVDEATKEDVLFVVKELSISLTFIEAVLAEVNTFSRFEANSIWESSTSSCPGGWS